MYLYIKALHVFAVVIFVGGMLLMAFTLRFAASGTLLSEREKRLVAMVTTWDSVVTTPALGLVWIAGFTMAFGAELTTSPWLLGKMIPVLFLSMLHGMEGTALKRIVRDGKPLPPLLQQAPAVTLVAFGIIVYLAVVKPF